MNSYSWWFGVSLLVDFEFAGLTDCLALKMLGEWYRPAFSSGIWGFEKAWRVAQAGLSPGPIPQH